MIPGLQKKKRRGGGRRGGRKRGRRSFNSYISLQVLGSWLISCLLCLEGEAGIRGLGKAPFKVWVVAWTTISNLCLRKNSVTHPAEGKFLSCMLIERNLNEECKRGDQELGAVQLRDRRFRQHSIGESLGSNPSTEKGNTSKDKARPNKRKPTVGSPLTGPRSLFDSQKAGGD